MDFLLEVRKNSWRMRQRETESLLKRAQSPLITEHTGSSLWDDTGFLSQSWPPVLFPSDTVDKALSIVFGTKKVLGTQSCGTKDSRNKRINNNS